MDRPVRAGIPGVRLPKAYYPEEMTHSYTEGSMIETNTYPLEVHGSQITLPMDAYLASIDIDVNSHQYSNFYTCELINNQGAPIRTLMQRIHDSGQKVLPLAIPENIPVGYAVRLSVTNLAGIKQIIVWHANYIY